MGQPAGPPTARIGARLGARLLDPVTWYVAYFLTAIPLMIWIDAGGGAAAQTALVAWLLTSFVLYYHLRTVYSWHPSCCAMAGTGCTSQLNLEGISGPDFDAKLERIEYVINERPDLSGRRPGP